MADGSRWWTRIDTQRGRTAVLAGVVLLMVGGAVLDVATGTFAAFGLAMLRFICPVGFVEISLATRSIVWSALPYTLLAIGVIFFVGRFPCGWLCPMYKIKHGLDRLIPDRIRTVSSRLPFDVTWRDGVAVLGGVLAVSAITGYPLYCVFCPIGIISRNLISLGTHLTIHPDLLLVPLYPLVLGVFVDWQRVCPVGNLGGVANQVAPLRVLQVEAEACVGCGNCLASCPEDIALYDSDADLGACTQCLLCLERCPEEAVGIWRRS